MNTTTGTPSLTTRPVANDEEEPPPPPYASQDPEPDSTRILQERLSAEAEAVGQTAPAHATPRTPITANSYAPPPGPPPAGPSRARPSIRTRSNRQSSPPPGPPSDEEGARVWEESQLDEAKRASIAAERERKELEEVMQLSLAEAEASGSGMSTVFEDVDDPGSRRVSSYAAPVQSEVPTHRRVTSEASASASMPASWQTRSLLDAEDKMAGMPALQPNRTGTTLQSKNPFLSLQERSHQKEDSAIGLDYSHLQQDAIDDLLNFASTSQQPSATSNRDSPGSRLAKYDAGNKSATMSPFDISTIPQYGLSLTTAPTLPSRTHPSTNTFPMSGENRPLPRPPSGISSQKLPNLPPRHDSLEMLNRFDTVFIGRQTERYIHTNRTVDDSASMAGERWEQARTAMMGVAEIAAIYDVDGVDIYFSNSKRAGKELKVRFLPNCSNGVIYLQTAQDVEDLFSGLIPRGSTS